MFLLFPQIIIRSELISSLTTFLLSFYLLCSIWPIFYLKHLTYRFQSENWEDASKLFGLIGTGDLCNVWRHQVLTKPRKSPQFSSASSCPDPSHKSPSKQTQEPAWEDSPSLYSRLSLLACRWHLSGQAGATPDTSPGCQAHFPHCLGSVLSGLWNLGSQLKVLWLMNMESS